MSVYRDELESLELTGVFRQNHAMAGFCREDMVYNKAEIEAT